MSTGDQKSPANTLATRQVYTSATLSPRQIVSAYDDAQWEDFIQEWTNGLKTEYAQVQRAGGAGDKGRDVIGFVTLPVSDSQWDNYQCKHYDKPLTPSEIWIELGKLCYFTHAGEYTVPRRYRFVAPFDVGPKLKDLLLKPDQLKAGLIENWDQCCKTEITKTGTVPLEGALLAHIQNFNFSIVGYAPLVTVLEQHMKTEFWATRFRLAPAARPPVRAPPTEIQANEARYIEHLLAAYGDAEKREIANLQELQQTPKYHEHLKRSRQWFFQAEALDRFSRDNYPTGEFLKIKKQVFDGVVDTAEADHAHGYARVCATTERAADIQLANSELAGFAEVADKKGICHHLANEDQLKWVKS